MTRVLLACPGVEHTKRGFETFARDCFEALRDCPELEIELVKGSGPAGPGEWAVPTLRRDSRLARAAARPAGWPPFVIEHLAFSAALLPTLARVRPDVVYFSEWHLGRALAVWRRVIRGRFRLVLCNGTSSPGPYTHLDAVQQLTPGALRYVLDRGADPERNVLLPLGFSIPARMTPLTPDERRALRERLGLPVDRRIVISVAALNRQKGIDRLIEAVAALPEPRPFLLLVGHVEAETPALLRLAEAALGSENHSVRTVPASEVADLDRAADVFALASLWEGLPRALIEAMAVGLPCVAHAYPVTDYALGDLGHTGNLERPGELARLLAGIRDSDLSPARAAARHAFVHERFSWDALRPAYVELLSGSRPRAG